MANQDELAAKITSDCDHVERMLQGTSMTSRQMRVVTASVRKYQADEKVYLIGTRRMLGNFEKALKEADAADDEFRAACKDLGTC